MRVNMGRSINRRVAFAILAALAVVAAGACRPGDRGTGSPAVVVGERHLMGTTFRIKLRTADSDAAERAIALAFIEVERVEELLSEWRETSEISEVNRMAGERPVEVGPELFEVVERSRVISRLVDGAFDVTFAGCGRLWSFRDRRIPEQDRIDECVGLVDYRRVELDAERSTIFLPDRAMRIGIAGIGKGYGVDRAAEVIESHGFTDYIVEGGGDVRVASGEGGTPWRIGIVHPRREGQMVGVVRLDRGSIVTSGDYELFFEREGVRYHHILDPRTGRPARGSTAVTVIAETATDADALATGMFVLGPETAVALAESTLR